MVEFMLLLSMIFSGCEVVEVVPLDNELYDYCAELDYTRQYARYEEMDCVQFGLD